MIHIIYIVFLCIHCIALSLCLQALSPGIEEARKLQGDAERSMKLAQREAREARQEKEKALRQRDAAEEQKRQAEAVVLADDKSLARRSGMRPLAPRRRRRPPRPTPRSRRRSSSRPG